MLSLILAFLCLQFSLDFDRTLHGERQTSVRLSEEAKGGNPTHHRPIEQLSLICTIKSFLFLDQLNIKHIFDCRVWIKFVKRNKGSIEWKNKLNVRMDFLGCGAANIFLISITLYRVHK